MGLCTLCTRDISVFNSFVFLSITTVCVWFLAPRIFHLCDQRLARNRFVGKQLHPSMQVPALADGTFSAETFLQSLLRVTRSNMPARDALLSHAKHMPITPAWQELQRTLHFDIAVAQVIAAAREMDREDSLLPLLQAALCEGVFIPEALETASAILRERKQSEQQLSSATAQAHVTMRILTVVPMVLFTTGLVFSVQFRHSVTTPAVAFFIVVGLVLNRVGAWWTRALISHATNRDTAADVHELIEHFCVSIRAGHHIATACSHWASVNSLGNSVAKALEEGHTFSHSLHPLSAHPHVLGAFTADILKAAYADGQAVHTTIATLSTQARRDRQHGVDTRVRQLPTKLTLPLVFCTLPSFGLLALSPILLSHLSRLSTVLPPPAL